MREILKHIVALFVQRPRCSEHLEVQATDVHVGILPMLPAIWQYASPQVFGVGRIYVHQKAHECQAQTPVHTSKAPTAGQTQSQTAKGELQPESYSAFITEEAGAKEPCGASHRCREKDPAPSKSRVGKPSQGRPPQIVAIRKRNPSESTRGGSICLPYRRGILEPAMLITFATIVDNGGICPESREQETCRLAWIV